MSDRERGSEHVRERQTGRTRGLNASYVCTRQGDSVALCANTRIYPNKIGHDCKSATDRKECSIKIVCESVGARAQRFYCGSTHTSYTHTHLNIDWGEHRPHRPSEVEHIAHTSV